MAVYVNFKHERSGERRSVKVGWSWTLFLFSGVLGIPLFLRRLHVWGGVMLGLWMVNIVGPSVAATDEEALVLQLIIGVGLAALGVFFGVKGNEMTARTISKTAGRFPTRTMTRRHSRRASGVCKTPAPPRSRTGFYFWGRNPLDESAGRICALRLDAARSFSNPSGPFPRPASSPKFNLGYWAPKLSRTLIKDHEHTCGA